MAGSSTIDIEHDLRRDRRGRVYRRIFLTVIAVAVLAGATGLLGVRTSTTRARATGVEGGDVELTVQHPRITRAGLPVLFTIEVTKAGGFDAPVTIAVTQRWLELFDEQGVRPAPESESFDGTSVLWEYEPPEGDTLRVSVDLIVETGRHSGRNARVAVLDEGGAELAAADIETVVVP